MCDLERLKDPFPAEDIEWRIAQKGVNGQGQPWAKVLAYIDNRAIQDRLDEVCGVGGWQNAIQHIGGAFLCGISIKIGDEWITKWDGAQESQIEATKGGISGAMKRSGSQWGIGRYLYKLTEGWAVIDQNGKHYSGKQKGNNGKPEVPAFRWNPPQLPPWALPSDNPRQPAAPPQITKSEAIESIKKADTLEGLAKWFAQKWNAISELPKADIEEIIREKDGKKAEFESAN